LNDQTSTSVLDEKFLLSLAVLALVAGTARAQGRAEGSITGTVSDETKAVLPGVTVTAVNPATGFTREAVTDAEGKFNLVALQPAPYEVTASLAGFHHVKKQCDCYGRCRAAARDFVERRVPAGNADRDRRSAARRDDQDEQGTQFNRTRSPTCR
jgi:hypothetical protein